MPKIALFAYWTPGIIAAQNLIARGCKPEDVLVFTYDDKRNRCFIDFCIEQGVCFHFNKCTSKFCQDRVESLSPDAIISMYYRDIIPDNILDIAPAMNMHAGRLPEYAGVLSSPWAIFNGEDYSGWTYHYMTSKLDAGNIVHSGLVEIGRYDTAYSVYHNVMRHALNADDFDMALARLLSGYSGTPQELSKRRIYRRGQLPGNGVISPTWSDQQIDRLIRALYFPPYSPAKTIEGYRVTTFDQYQKLVDSGETERRYAN